MTSERQAEANRQNATKSTGPRTPAGKAVVTLNGIKHGLLSRECLLKGESHRPEPAQTVGTAARFVDAADLPLAGVDGVVRALVEASISVQAPL